MLLFNLIFARSLSTLPNSFLYYLDRSTILDSYKNKKQSDLLPSLPCLASSSGSLSVSSKKLADKSLLSVNLFTRVVNKFWQQKIFLSIPDELSDKYTDQLNSLDKAKNKTSNKKFLSQFSQSLISSSVQSSLSSKLTTGEQSSSVMYIWKKSWINALFTVLSKTNKSLNKTYKYLGKQSEIKNFPLFIIINDFNQMVIAEPPEEPRLSYWSTSRLSKLQPSYQGWFFTNCQDAEEYLRYIKKQYGISDTDDQLRIFICDLGTFYKLLKKSTSAVQFRLVPDLHEVGKLVNTYSFYPNVTFHKNQNFGQDYFQGQPIYLIKQDNYSYKVMPKGKKKSYRPIFTSYEAAISECTKLKLVKKRQKIELSKSFDLIAYNLEDFLYEHANQSDQHQLPFLLIPSKEAYQFTKNIQLQQSSYLIHNNSVMNLSNLNLWIKRIFWSLTSKQPQDL